MGFRSLLTIPIISSNSSLGLIFLFSKSAFHFSSETLEIYQSISNQIGLSVNERYLQEKLTSEARYLLTGEIATRIGGDVKQVLRGLEVSRQYVESALGKRSWNDMEQSWSSMSRQIWHLYHVTLNILSYGSENLKLFFPEDLNQIIKTSINQITSRPFSKQLQFRFDSVDAFSEVYINKMAIQRALINLLLLAVESCWFEDQPLLVISLKSLSGTGDRYALDVYQNGDNASYFTECLKDYLQNEEISRLPVLLAAVVRCAEAHNGELSVITSDKPGFTFRLVLPRHPEK